MQKTFKFQHFNSLTKLLWTYFPVRGILTKLAQLLRLGTIHEVWQHSAEQAYLKELVRTHENLISDCIKVMSRIKAIYRSQAIKCAGTSVYQASKRDEWLAKL